MHIIAFEVRLISLFDLKFFQIVFSFLDVFQVLQNFYYFGTANRPQNRPQFQLKTT